MDELINRLREKLTENSDPVQQEGAKRYFKEPINCYGIKSSQVTNIGRAFYSELKGKPKSEIYKFCDELWESGMMEESFIASSFSYRLHKQYEPFDFNQFEKWVHQNISNWASCDGFCNHTIGEFVMKYPEFISRLKIWANSENRWVRRAAAVSLIVPGRKGLFLDQIFEISDLLLFDKDDMVQKGYGWLLKVASQVNQNQVFGFIMKRKDVMPRTALRYSIEKMPPERREQAMQRG
jgi:3-methyladenine DNA glycosylase AlkD